jgi:hypothetical protein
VYNVIHPERNACRRETGAVLVPRRIAQSKEEDFRGIENK